MKGKFFDLDSQKGLYPGAPSYASAEEVRADLDVLTEEEAEAIFAAAVHTHAISDVTGLQSTLNGLEWISWRGARS